MKILDARNTGDPQSIQHAIDALPEEGGEICLKPGRYLTGPLTLRTGLSMNLEEGAELIFSEDLSLYPPVFTRWEGTECHAFHPLIFAEGCHTIRLYGGGIIDGNGSTWWSAYQSLKDGNLTTRVSGFSEKLKNLNIGISNASGGGGRETGFLRPPLFQLKECRGIEIRGLVLRNSPFWNTHILYSSEVLLENLSFENPPDAPNTDGLDIDSSRNVTVRNCRFRVGDDCLCIKSGSDEDGIRLSRPSSGIHVSGCVMEEGHGAVVIGSETAGGVRDVTVENCRFTGTDRGIRIKTRRGRGGTVEDLILKNIVMDSVAAPLVINMYYRCGADPAVDPALAAVHERPVGSTTPVIRNILVEEVKALNVSSSSAFLLGLPESPIRGLIIRNLSIEPAKEEASFEPAMDFFYTRAEGPKILWKNLEDCLFENINIRNHRGPVKKEIVLEELLNAESRNPRP